MRHQFPKIAIPNEWTKEQVCAVIDFLYDIESAIWDIHYDKLLEAMIDELSPSKETVIDSDNCHHDEDSSADFCPMTDEDIYTMGNDSYADDKNQNQL